MEMERLRSTYAQNSAVRAICDHMAMRERNQNETKLHRILKHLANDGHDLKRTEIIAAFRALEEVGCGQYVEGRHGWPSRFVWEVPSLNVLEAAKGRGKLERDSDANDKAMVDGEEEDLVEHQIVLRPDLTVSFELPGDLTRGEAARLVLFVQSIPFEGA